ncbi:MAG: AAA family ATPase [Caldilineaceae bacterium]
MSTLDTARFFAQLKQAPCTEAVTLLSQVGLAEHADKPVAALRGMNNGCALALALLGDPPILVLDEPTSNLDPAGRSQFLQLLAQVKAAGKTILFTSHRLEEIEQIADQVIVMERCGALDLPRRQTGNCLGIAHDREITPVHRAVGQCPRCAPPVMPRDAMGSAFWSMCTPVRRRSRFTH